ncbi:hypothetical protein BS47DRAFT_1337102, partial [Hydnum rufescens UP504]
TCHIRVVFQVQQLFFPELFAFLQLRLPIDISLKSCPSHATLVPQILSEFTSWTNSHNDRCGHLDLHLVNKSDTSSYLGTASRYSVKLGCCRFTCANGHPEITLSDRNMQLGIPKEGIRASDVVRTLEDLLIPHVPSVQAQFSPRYRLAFSLLNEDAAVGGAASSWAIEDAIDGYLTPTLTELSIVHNFTIESQVQYHAPLAFEPSPGSRTVADSEWKGYELDQDELKTFINSAEWTLASSVNNDIVLHFILFVPTHSRRPLWVLKPDGTRSSTNAFIIPQWGGVAIEYLSARDRAHPFAIFRSQLHSLLGVPSVPLNIAVKSDSVLSAWQLDALLRRRGVENTKGTIEALNSIMKLADRISNMPVRVDVRGDVLGALDALDDVHTHRLSSASLLSRSSEALTLSSRAFFNPGMLAMLYFPVEHKYAVYTPLFAPVSVPLLVATIKEIRAWRQERRKKLGGDAKRDSGGEASTDN